MFHYVVTVKYETENLKKMQSSAKLCQKQLISAMRRVLLLSITLVTLPLALWYATAGSPQQSLTGQAS